MNRIVARFGYWKGFGKHLAFGTGVSILSFGAAMIIDKQKHQNIPWYQSNGLYKLWKGSPQHQNTSFALLDNSIDPANLPDILNQLYAQLHPYVWTIISVNIGVFSLWKASHTRPMLQTMLNKWFIADPLSTRVLPHLLSSFSHQSGAHIAMNMLVLASCSRAVISGLGPEQFLAAYMSCSVLASVIGRFLSYGTLLVPSLGASHSVLSTFIMSTLVSPNALYMIVFFPFVQFTAQQIMISLVVFESIGFIGARLGYSLFMMDHGAHLAGLGFGFLYYHYGREYIWKKRRQLVKYIS